ncbi:vWA domain-containing protein [Stetteria hydrogenophila]
MEGGRLPIDLVFAVDISPSMGKPHEGFKPSKLSVVRDALAYVGSRLLGSGLARLGLVVFYRYAFPILPLTRDKQRFLSTLPLIKVGGSGTAAGNGLIEAVKLLRGSVREKVAVVITDGGLNEGVNISHAAIYARNMGVRTYIVSLAEGPKGSARRAIEEAAKITGGAWLHAEDRQSLLSILASIARAAG